MIKKSEFNQMPSCVEYEGAVVRINFDIEESTRVINNEDGGEGETQVIYLAYVIRVAHPLTVDRIKTILLQEGFDEFKAEEVAADTMLKLVQNGEVTGDALALAKQVVVARINAYDKSDAVNRFTYNGVPMWLDKETRNGLIARLNAEKAAKKAESTLWLGTQSFTITPTEGLSLLNALEIYASESYDKTQEHKAAVMALDNVADVLAYDFTAGYPDNPEF